MIYLLIGRRERGKTTLAYSMARKARKRVIIDARRMIQRESERVHTVNDLNDALVDLVFDEHTYEIVFQPTEDDLEIAFESFIGAIKTRLVSSPDLSLAIMIDEASFYNLDDARFQWIAKCTQREKIHILITAHRPSDIPTSIRAIADHWCIFATTQEHDLKVIEQRSGSSRVVDAVRRLRERDYVHWNDSKGTMTRCSDADGWYVPLSVVSRKPEVIIPEPEDEDFKLE